MCNGNGSISYTERMGVSAKSGMNILLLRKSTVVEPHGVMYLAGAYKRLGYGVDILTYNTREDVLHHNLEDYDAVGMSILTGSHIEAFDIAQRIKKSHPSKFLGVGGQYTLFEPNAERCLEFFDSVCVGESLTPFWQKTGVWQDANLTNYEILPDRSALYVNAKYKSSPVKTIFASTGCPFSCTHCQVSRKVRWRPVDLIVEELKDINKQGGCQTVFFGDDCFGVNVSWLEEFAKKWPGHKYHAQMRVDMLDDERLKLLVKSGCSGVTFAIESANETVRRLVLGKNKYSNEDIVSAVERLKSYKLRFRTEQMIGLPLISFEDDLELIKLNKQIKPNIAWSSIYTPYRGSKLAEWCVKVGIYDGVNDDCYDDFFTKCVLKYDNKRVSQIEHLQKVFSICVEMEDGYEIAKESVEQPLHHAYKNTRYKQLYA